MQGKPGFKAQHDSRRRVRGIERLFRWMGGCALALFAAALIASVPLTAHAERAGVDDGVASTNGNVGELSSTVHVIAVNGDLRIEDKTDDFAGSVSDVNAVFANEPLRVQVAGGEGFYAYAWSLDIDGETVSEFSDSGVTEYNNVEVTHAVGAREISREGMYRYRLSVSDAAGDTVEAEVHVVVSSDYRWADGDPLAGDAYDEDLRFIDEYTGADIKVAGSMHKNARLVVDRLATTTPAYLALASAARGAPIAGAWVVRLVVDGQAAEDVEPFVGPVMVSVRYPGSAFPKDVRALASADADGKEPEDAYAFPDRVLFMASDASVESVDCSVDDARRWLTFETRVLGTFAALGKAPESSTHEVTIAPSVGGSTWPADPVRVADGDTAVFALLPDAGYATRDAVATGGAKVRVEGNMLYVGPVAADANVSVTFARVEADPGIEYTVSARVDGGHGSVSVAGGDNCESTSVKAARGAVVPVGFVPDAGWTVDAVTVNGAPVIALAGGYLVSALDEDIEVVVSYRKGVEPPATVFSVSASVEGRGGIVSPSYVQVPLGGSASVSFVPDPGYAVSTVKVDGVALPGAPASHTFDTVSQNHDVKASFAWVGPGPEPDPDVPDVPDVPDPDDPDEPDVPGPDDPDVPDVPGPDVPDVPPFIVGPDGNPYPTDPDGNPIGPDGNPIPIDPDTGTPIGPDGSPLPVGPDGNYHPDPTDPFYGIDENGNQVVRPSARFSVKVTSEGSGSVSPAGEVIVAAGASQAFWFYPDAGWQVGRVYLDGEALAGAPSHWEIAEASSDHALHVVFVREGASSDERSENSRDARSLLLATGDKPGMVFGVLVALMTSAAAMLCGARRARMKRGSLGR